MAEAPSDIDKELVKQVNESALDSLYYYPVRFYYLEKTKPRHFGNIVFMPVISVALDIKCNHVNTYTIRTYYLGFSPDEDFKPKNQILDKVEMEHLNAKKIVVSSTSEGFRTDHKIKVIVSSYVLNEKFGTDLTWVAFFGFDISAEDDG